MTALLEYLDLLQIQATQNRIYGCSTKWAGAYGDMVLDSKATGVQ